MDEKIITPLQSLLRRTALFLRDFLPENNLQLLFPLASLVLFVGGSFPWLPPRHVLSSLQFQHQDGTLWFDLSTRLLVLRYYAILYAVHFGFLGSVALWCLPLRGLWRKFAAWVFLPSALAVVCFLAIVLLSRAQAPSLFESRRQVLQEDLHEFPNRLLHLGTGFYITLLGIGLLVVSLWIARVCRVPLPVRFHETARRQGNSVQAPDLSRKIFVVVIAATAIAMLVGLTIFTSMIPTAGKVLPWYDNWPQDFAAWRWLPDLLDGLAVAACAVILIRTDQGTPPTSSTNSIASSAAIALFLPLSVALLPRFVLKALFAFTTVLSNVPYEFFGFRGFPWVLIVFVIAGLQEFTLRVCLQNRLEKKFGFKRACLLIALLRWILPLSSGFGAIPGLRIGIPGVSVLVSLLAHILYNTPLAWLYARTRSLWLVALMHGTILLFRAGGAAYNVYFTFRHLYWIETAAWIFITWYLFKKLPLGEVTALIDQRHA